MLLYYLVLLYSQPEHTGGNNRPECSEWLKQFYLFANEWRTCGGLKNRVQQSFNGLEFNVAIAWRCGWTSLGKDVEAIITESQLPIGCGRGHEESRRQVRHIERCWTLHPVGPVAECSAQMVVIGVQVHRDLCRPFRCGLPPSRIGLIASLPKQVRVELCLK